jgi:hypothetical protein
VLKRGVMHFWLRFVNWHGFLALALSVVLFLYLLFTGERSWLLGVSGTVTLLGIIFALRLYFAYLGRALGRFERMKSKSVQITFTDESFSTTTDLGSGSVNWNNIRFIWRFPDVWLLFLEWNNFMSLPTENLDDEVKAFIVERVQGHGGKVA